jgi:multidrug efflux pump
VIVVIFRSSMRAVLIPVVAIPISLVGAVFLARGGFTVNLLTLLAIVLVALVVDDAIGWSRTSNATFRTSTAFQAAINAAREPSDRSSP